MAIYTKIGRSMMASSFYRYAKGIGREGDLFGKSPLWFGFSRGLGSDASSVGFAWNYLTTINGGTAITEDVPPDPILYPSPESRTLSNTDAQSELPSKYYSTTDYPPEIYKRVGTIQYIYPDVNGDIIYLENAYSAYDSEQEAMDNGCNLVRIACAVSTQDLTSAGILPQNFTTRQIGVYSKIDDEIQVPASRPNLVVRQDVEDASKQESDLGLSLIDNTLPYHRVEYQRDEFSFVLQF